MKVWQQYMIAVICGLSLAGCASTGTSQGSDPYWSDSGTTLHVKTALMSAGVVKFSLISVTTNQGVVQLNGSVSSAQEQELAGTIARGVSGVRQVENNLVVNASD